MQNDWLDFLYSAVNPIKSLPEYKHGKFEHSKELLVATVQGIGDGQTVEVYECRLPARFFTLRVLSGTNSIGEHKAGYEVGTGSDMGELAGTLAHAIANGMISFRGNK